MVRCSFGRFSFYHIYLHYLCLQATSFNVAFQLFITATLTANILVRFCVNPLPSIKNKF